MPELSRAREKALLGGALLSYLGIVMAVYPAAALSAGNRGRAYLAIHFALTFLCWAIWKLSARERAHAIWVLSAGIVARVLLARAPSFTSHDVFRYLWDGFIALKGGNPYVVSPEAFAALQPVGDFRAIWPDNASFPTIYPPLALAIFSFCARWGPEGGVGVWKLIVTSASVATLLISWRWLKRQDRLRYLTLPAFFPLLVLEAGVGAHLDLLVAPFLLLALFAGRRPLAGAALGVASVLKLYPLILFPFLVPREKARAAKFLGAGLGIVAAVYAVAAVAGWRGSGSLDVYLRDWSFGSPAGRIFEEILPKTLARFFLLVGFVGAYGLFLFQKGRRPNPEVDTVKALSLLWIYSPVVFPWYLAPLAALGAVMPSAFILTWASLLPLTYEVIDAFDRGWGWTPAAWPLVVVALGWILAGPRQGATSSSS